MRYCPVLLILLCFGKAVGGDKPIQLSFVTPFQLFNESTSISGIRLNLIYGRNISVTGFDTGFINHNTGGVSKGFQSGFAGIIQSNFSGLQSNAFNIVQGKAEGFQCGIMNYGRNVSGVQLGLVNYAEIMYGLQIGLINIIRQDGAFPVFPLVNWSFHL